MRKLRWAIGASFFMFGLSLSAAQSPLFFSCPGPAPQVARGSGPALLADVNGDGNLDLITKHLTNKTVSVLLGDGHGHFSPAPASSLRLDFEPGWIALSSVNQGKRPMLAVANKENNKECVRVFLGNDQGGFNSTSKTRFCVRASQFGYKPVLQFVDLNEDGNVDLVSGSGRREAFEVYLGDGRGGFSPGPISKLEIGSKVRSFAFGDLDGDGHIDLATTTTSSPPDGTPGRLDIRRGNGRGDFAAATSVPIQVPKDPTIAALVDVNNEGRLDIALSHGRTNILTLLVNDGRGGFASQSHLPLETGTSAYGVAGAEISGDWYLDLILTIVSDSAPFDSKIGVFFNDRQGGFVPTPGSPFTAAPGAYTLATGDLNGDGKLDIVASSFESATVTVLLGR